jgi:glycogen(starch) synthase
MRLIMLSWEYPPRIIGGISKVVYNLAQSLGRSGNEVHVISFWEEGTRDFEYDNNVFVHRVRLNNVSWSSFIEWVMQLNFAMLECAVGLLRQKKFDIIHAHDWLVAYAAKVLKNSFSIPLISTIHATESGRNNGIHTDMQRDISSIEKMLSEQSDRLIVNSKYMKDEISSIFDISKDKISIVRNGADLNKFDIVNADAEFRNNYAAPNEKIVFFVGRLVNEKGVHILIDAIPQILGKNNNVKFVIAGRGPCLNNLIDQSRNLNVYNKVYFTGFVCEEVLLKLYKCSNIAVFPSTYEPFGIVALEGMVAGIPVVVSDTGGLREIVNHRENGMRFYSGNSNSLADCILELLENEELSKQITGNALEIVHRLYNWNNITKKLLQEYKYVISQYNSSNQS